MSNFTEQTAIAAQVSKRRGFKVKVGGVFMPNE